MCIDKLHVTYNEWHMQLTVSKKSLDHNNV